MLRVNRESLCSFCWFFRGGRGGQNHHNHKTIQLPTLLLLHPFAKTDNGGLLQSDEPQGLDSVYIKMDLTVDLVFVGYEMEGSKVLRRNLKRRRWVAVGPDVTTEQMRAPDVTMLTFTLACPGLVRSGSLDVSMLAIHTCNSTIPVPFLMSGHVSPKRVAWI